MPMRKLTFILAFLLLAGLQHLHAQINLDTLTALKNNPGIYSLVISKNDKVIYNSYFNQQGQDSLLNDQSLTKDVISTLIGIAIDKGYIKSVDEKVFDFFPELINDTDKRKQDITIRQIMYHENLDSLAAFLNLPNPSAYVLKAPLTARPGKVYHYSNAATHLLSVILTKSTGMDTHTFAIKYLFAPMSINNFGWMKMNDGYYDGSGLLSIRLRSTDMLKIGSLFLHKGVYDDMQVVPAKWINLVLHPDTTYHTEWGFEQSTYALCWYHAVYKGTDITYGLGWGGQFLIIIPSLQAVVVANENPADASAIKQEIIFMHRIFPVIFDQLNNP